LDRSTWSWETWIDEFPSDDAVWDRAVASLDAGDAA
jgi:hypothetical protein